MQTLKPARNDRVSGCIHSAISTGLISFTRGIHKNLRFEEREMNERTNVRTNKQMDGRRKKGAEKEKSLRRSATRLRLSSRNPAREIPPRRAYPAVSPATIIGIRLVILRTTAGIPVRSIDNE